MIRPVRRSLCIGLGLAGAAAAVPGIARAQAWPTRPLKIVVPYPAGGAPDATARRIAEKLSAQLGQPVVVENRPGGSAVIGALFGRKKISSTTIGKAATSMRSASRAARQQADVAHAEESLSSLEEKRRLLEDELDAELERIRLEFAPERMALERVEVPARKTGTTVEDVVLAWVPRRERAAEARRPW
jgi:alanine dehydrogenase